MRIVYGACHSFILTWGMVFGAIGDHAQAAAPPLYDTDPGHLWNRLYQTIFIRTAPDGTTYGIDSLEPLLWPKTEHLIVGQSYEAALAVLDEFIDKRGERLIADPVKRAMMLRDLWVVFDWAATWNNRKQPPEHQAELAALTSRLATIIRRMMLIDDAGRLTPTHVTEGVQLRVYRSIDDQALTAGNRRSMNCGFSEPRCSQDRPAHCTPCRRTSGITPTSSPKSTIPSNPTRTTPPHPHISRRIGCSVA